MPCWFFLVPLGWSLSFIQRTLSQHRSGDEPCPTAPTFFVSSHTSVDSREGDGKLVSSEGSQLRSTTEEPKNDMSYDSLSARSSIRPSIHDAAQGLAYLAMLASRECAPQYAGSSYDHGHAPFQSPEHTENFRRGPARAAAARGPAPAAFGEARPAPHAAILNGASHLGF